MLLTLALPFGCVGCSDGGSATYEQISGAEAKALMDSESRYIILDVREQYVIIIQIADKITIFFAYMQIFYYLCSQL